MIRNVLAVVACCFAMNAVADDKAMPAKADMTDHGGGMTCGQVFAAKVPMINKMADMMEAGAAYFEIHAAAIDRSDKTTKAEYDLLMKEVKSHKELAKIIRATADRMAKAKDMPAGKHDEKKMSDPKMMEAAKKGTMAKKEVATMMLEDAKAEEAMMGKKTASAE